MTFPTDTVLTNNTIVKVQLLPGSGNNTFSRSPVLYTVTNTADALTNDNTLSLQASGFVSPATSILLEQNTVLAFGSVSVTLISDTTLTSTPVNVFVSPLIAPIAANAQASIQEMFTLLGGDDLSVEVTDKDVETRSFENGLFDDARKVMVGGNVPFNGFYRAGNLAITRVIKPSVLSAREVLISVTYPNGDYLEAAAFIKNYKETSKLDDIRRFTWTFRIVGDIKRTKSDTVTPVIPVTPTSPILSFSDPGNSGYLGLLSYGLIAA